MSGVQVKAIAAEGNNSLFSITNLAGVFVLESLQAGTYTLTIQGKPAKPNTIVIDQHTQAFQEINLTFK